jgi:hypothetical protein
MARIVKPEDEHQVFRMLSDYNPNWELNLVGYGKRAYIWTPMGTYSGQQTLRKFAQAILKEIPARKS